MLESGLTSWYVHFTHCKFAHQQLINLHFRYCSCVIHNPQKWVWYRSPHLHVCKIVIMKTSRPEWTSTCKHTTMDEWMVCGQDTFFHWVLANLPIAEGSKIGSHPTGWTQNRKIFLVRTIMRFLTQVSCIYWKDNMTILVVLECPMQFELVFTLGMVCHDMVYLDILYTDPSH